VSAGRAPGSPDLHLLPTTGGEPVGSRRSSAAAMRSGCALLGCYRVTAAGHGCIETRSGSCSAWLRGQTNGARWAGPLKGPWVGPGIPAVSCLVPNVSRPEAAASLYIRWFQHGEVCVGNLKYFCRGVLFEELLVSEVCQ